MQEAAGKSDRSCSDYMMMMVSSIMSGSGFTGKAPGGPSRWSTGRSGEWEPVRPSLVVEVQFDHVTGGRFRHGTKLLRWRPTRHPPNAPWSRSRVAWRRSCLEVLEGWRRGDIKQHVI
jgi:ATP-dependent DNA ligase